MTTRAWAWIFLMTAYGCATDIELIVPGEPLPVVYCLLDPEDSVQYVRIGSTYAINPGESEFRPEQEEILIGEEILVYLVAEYMNLQQKVMYAHRIDTIPKDPGWFPSSVNQLYAIPCVLEPGTRYSLYVHFIASGRIVHGETVSNGSPFILIDPDIVPGREATLLPGIDFFVRFRPVIGGSVFQSTMTFRYADIRDGQWTEQSLVLPQKFVYQRNQDEDYGEQRISGERFLIDVSRALQPVPGIRRVPLALDFHVSCGGDDLALKISAENNTQSFSILEVNSFDNAIGVFSTLIHRYVKDVPLSIFTIDNLSKDPLTRNLGFLTAQQIDSLNYESR
jgi:hypothetical protein